MLKLEFEEDDNGSGDGTLIISIDGINFCFVPITHTGQKEIIQGIVGEYKKINYKA